MWVSPRKRNRNLEPPGEGERGEDPSGYDVAGVKHAEVAAGHAEEARSTPQAGQPANDLHPSARRRPTT
jgi:hypothetical protein